MASTSERNISISDIPQLKDIQHQQSEVTYEPYSAGEGRYKSFHPRVASTRNQLIDLVDNFKTLSAHLGTQENDETISRVQMRAVVDANVLPDLGRYDWFREHVEGICLYKPDRALLYIAENSAERVCDVDDELTIQEIVESIQTKSIENPDQIISKPLQHGFHLGIMKDLPTRSDAEEIVSQTAALYKRFGWQDVQSVKDFLLGPDRLFAGLVDSNGQLQAVSILLFEKATLENEVVVMGELTEASSNVSGIGAYAALSELLILQAARLSAQRKVFGSSIDFLYGESNALSAPVQVVVNKQGRVRAAHDNRLKNLGFPNTGRLRQQVYIDSGVTQASPKNDLWLNYIPQSQLENHNEYYDSCIRFI